MPNADRTDREGDGAPAAILFYDSAQFERGRVVLEEAGLSVRISQPGGNLGALRIAYGLPMVAGRLWVAVDDLDRAMTLLEAAGVAAGVSGPPILDAESPACPSCGYNLTSIASTTCPVCGGEFIRHDEGPASSEPQATALPKSPPIEPGPLGGSPDRLRLSSAAKRRWRGLFVLIVLIVFGVPCLAQPLEMLLGGTPADQITAVVVLGGLAIIALLIGRGMTRR